MDLVRKSVGSNPTLIKPFLVIDDNVLRMAPVLFLLHSITHRLLTAFRDEQMLTDSGAVTSSHALLCSENPFLRVDLLPFDS